MNKNNRYNLSCKVFYVILILFFLSLSFVYTEQSDAKKLDKCVLRISE